MLSHLQGSDVLWSPLLPLCHVDVTWTQGGGARDRTCFLSFSCSLTYFPSRLVQVRVPKLAAGSLNVWGQISFLSGTLLGLRRDVPSPVIPFLVFGHALWLSRPS